MHPIPAASLNPRYRKRLPSPTHLQTRPAMPIGSFSDQKPAPQSPQAGSDSVERVKTLCCRFHSVARQLRLRGEYRATLSVEDEFDAQDLLHALLRIQFDNIDTDEWTPSYSSGTPRTTLLLNDSRLAVIVKKTRPVSMPKTSPTNSGLTQNGIDPTAAAERCCALCTTLKAESGTREASKLVSRA